MGRPKIQDKWDPVRVGDNRYKLSDGRIVSRQRLEQLRHPDKVSERNKKWAKSENGKALAKRWRDANPEYRKKYYEENKEKIKQYQRERYLRLKAEREQG